MFRKSLLHVVIGLVISLTFSGLVYYHLLIDTIDIFGYSELTNPEIRHAKIFYTSFAITGVTVLLAVTFAKLRYRDFATGFVLPALIGFLPMIAVGPTYFDKSNYYEEFNQTLWLSQHDDRIKMARQLVKTKILLGFTREQVIAKLGNDFFENGEMNYPAIADFCFLGIRFENNKVVDYSLWVRD